MVDDVHKVGRGRGSRGNDGRGSGNGQEGWEEAHNDNRAQHYAFPGNN